MTSHSIPDDEQVPRKVSIGDALPNVIKRGSFDDARDHLSEQYDEVFREVYAHRAAKAVEAAEFDLFEAERDPSKPGLIEAEAKFELALQNAKIYGILNLREHVFAQCSSPYVGMHFLVDAECGVGKSTGLAHRLRDDSSLRATIVVPDHEISGDLTETFEAALGGDFAVVRGRTADDPSGIGKMCKVPELVEQLWQIGGRAKDLCGKRTGDQENANDKCCPHRDSCAYFQQNFEARVTMMAGAGSLSQMEKIKIKPDLIIMDDMSIERLMRQTSFPLVKLATFPAMQPPTEAKISAADLNRIQHFCVDMNTIVQSTEPGAMLWSNDLEILGDVASVFRRAKVDYKKFIKPADPTPGITEVTRRFSSWNQRCDLLAELADAVARVQYGGQATIQVLRSKIDTVTLVVRSPQKIAHSCRNVPVVILDATGNKSALDMFFQSDVKSVPAPWVDDFAGVKHYKVGDKLMGYRSWTLPKVDRYANSPEQFSKDAKTAENNIQWLVQFLDKLHFEYGRVGAVLPKETVVRVKEIWDQRKYRPAGVQLSSLSKARGINSMDDVEALVVLSRPGIQAKDFEPIAATLTGRNVTQVSRFDTIPARYNMTDGTTSLTTREYHPDPAVEMLREQSVEAVLRQAGARARPKSANGRERLHVFWLQSTPTEKAEYHQVIPWNLLRSWVTEYDWLPSVGFLPLERIVASFAFALKKSERAVGIAFQRNKSIRSDYDCTLSRYRERKLPGAWSEWNVFPQIGLTPFAVAIQVKSEDITAAKELLNKLNIEMALIEPRISPAPASLPLPSAQPTNIDTHSGSLCMEPAVGGSEITLPNNGSIVPQGDGPLGILFKLGIFPDMHARGVACLVAALIARTPKAVERIFSKHPDVRDHLQHAYETEKSGFWSIRSGRYNVCLKLQNADTLDQARLILASAGLSEEVLSTLMPSNGPGVESKRHKP